jgi:hypothetical protein
MLKLFDSNGDLHPEMFILFYSRSEKTLKNTENKILVYGVPSYSFAKISRRGNVIMEVP